MLTVLLVLELCAEFVVGPLAACGLPIARAVADALVLTLLAIVVLLSHRPGAIISIALGLAAIIASLVFGTQAPPATATLLRRGGGIFVFSALWFGHYCLHALQQLRNAAEPPLRVDDATRLIS